jgi:putative 2-oxoglutarate-Fe(II)-dependent oxygenase superfamily protein
MPPIRINSAFAVAFGEGRLAACSTLNRELEALFLARETEEYRNPTPSHRPQQEMFESRFNLFSWPEGCIQQLRAFVLESVAQTVMETSDLKRSEMADLRIQNHTWFHITRYAGSFVAHNHPLASWSAVYCVRAGETVAAHPDSGVLRFLDTRPGADAYVDIANRRLRPAFALKSRQMRLEEGQVVVFPSFVFHEVAPFYGRDTRITVATNCWFTSGQA